MTTKNMLAILGITLSMLPFKSIAQTQVTKYTIGIVAEGVSYFLPKTEIEVQVVSTSTTYTPGEFCRYAERYMHLKNVRQAPETKHAIVNMSMRTLGIPDTTKHYTIKLKDKSIAPFVHLDDNGVLLAINTSVDNEKNELSVPEDKINTINSKEFLTHEILSANSVAKMAELTATEIYDIRESRSAIMKGQVETMPKDGASLKIILDELNRHEESLMQLFTGYEETKTEIRTYRYLPTAHTEKGILFRHSEKLGFTDKDDLAGNPYYISISDQRTVSIPTVEESKKQKITGVVYNIPSLTKVKIHSATQTYFDSEIPIAQFGCVDVLSSTLFNKGASTKVTLSPSTGGIMKIEK
jgi:hypothetical protein